MKKYKDIFLINVTSIIIGIITYCFFGEKPELPIALLATGISISFGIRQYKIENDKMFKELFSSFNEKYDNKFNNVLNEIENKTERNKQYKLTTDEMKLIIDYLNFCAEEYLWFVKGRIDQSVWQSWENGMKYYLNILPIKNLVEAQKGQKDSYYGLFEKLKL
jgi:hypothetical protein